MRFSVLLCILHVVLKIASYTHSAFKKYISKADVKVVIKTADGERARLFIFDKGRFTSISGDRKDYDVALVWKDAKAGFSAMTNSNKVSIFTWSDIDGYPKNLCDRLECFFFCRG